MSTGIEDVLAAIIAPDTRAAHSVDRGHQGSDAIDHCRIDDLALAGLLGFEQAGDDSERKVESAAAEIAVEIQGRYGGFAASSNAIEGARERDVIDIVSCGLRERALLAPSRHPAI